MYVPAADTVIDCVVAPVDHVFPVAELDVNVTEFPEHNDVEPLAVIVGVAGAPGSDNVADTVFDAHPLLNVKLYEPAPRPDTTAGNVAAILPDAVPVQDNVPVPEPVI